MRKTLWCCPMCGGELKEDFVLEDPTKSNIGSCVECGYVTILARLIGEG